MKRDSVRNYQFYEEIGRGNASQVYRAIHKPSSKVTAVKVIPHEMLEKKIGQERWYSEPKFQCPLKHENVIECYNFFIEDGRGYLVMEYVDGFTLRHCVEGHAGRLDDQRTCFNHLIDTAVKICKGLSYLHEQNIVHGHIKPENILVSREITGPYQVHKQVKISDFVMAGLVKGFFRKSAHAMGGTLKYMSPEQIEKKEVTFRSDIFSLGVSLYELFTGQYPWDGPSARKELLAKLLSPKYNPPPPSQLVSSFPKQLDATIMKMLEKNEKDRHETIVEVWLDLSNAENLRI